VTNAWPDNWPAPDWAAQTSETQRRDYAQTHRDETLGWEDIQPVRPARPLRPHSTPIHRHGIAWDETPPPWRWLRWAHRCRRDTHYWQAAADGAARELVERCRCGAQRTDCGPWHGRFSR
jgi:hypothetical protein